MYGFEWSTRKAASNEHEHGISFREASEAFDDPFSLTIPDPDHSRDEERHVLIGCTRGGEILVVVHALRGERYPLDQRPPGNGHRENCL